MATHSSILAWENPMDRGAWWATDHGVARVGHDLATKQQQHASAKLICPTLIIFQNFKRGILIGSVCVIYPL